MNLSERIKFLRHTLSTHNHSYYVLDKPTISDFEFDKLMNELIKLENQNPSYFDEHSPSQRVGGDLIEGFKTVNHKYKMLSLGNTYSDKDLIDFDKRVHKLTNQKIDYVCELKYDGVSISLTYINGKLKQAVTRGDGTKGDDVTANVKTIKSIPLKLTGEYPDEFEIRGEIFMPINGLKKLNKQRINKGLYPYANTRNTASGSLKMLDTKEVSKRHLDCYLYYLLGDNLPSDSHFENLIKAKEWGFKIPNEIKIYDNIEQVLQFIKKWEKNRHKLAYDIDGIVIKVNNINLQNEMGFTAKFPRWAISYKFKAEKVSTIFNNISYQVGRTGAITPVANFNAVILAGSTVKRASLHNEDQIKKLDIRIGDTVYVEKGGDIIPKIVSVNINNRDIFSLPIKFIEECPSCKSKLVRNKGDSKHYCKNFNNCTPQIIGKFEHFISRKAMDIDGLGSETIELLVKNKVIKDVSDLYSLKVDNLLPFKKDGNKWAKNIINGIQNSKDASFNKVLFAIGIRYVGETVANKLASYFKNIDNLMTVSYEELINAPEIGEKIANSIINFFSIEKNILLINNLKKHSLNLELINDKRISNRLEGESIVISGVFTNYSRKELKEIIQKHGGKQLISITKNTTFVLAGKNMGPSKKQKARDLNIPIITEEEFLTRIS